MGLFFAVVASLFASFNNYMQKRSIDVGGTSKGFLIIQLFTSFCVMMVLNPILGHSYEICTNVCLFGVIGGLFLGLLTWSIGKTLERGPAGLTFAILFSSSVVPSILFVLLFGPFFGFTYTIWNAFGAVLVISGIFWASKIAKRTEMDDQESGKSNWGPFMTLAFTIHALFLAYLGIWALVLRGDHPYLSSFAISEPQKLWFMPIMLLTAALLQLCIYISEFGFKKFPTKKEIFYGVQGGTCHGLCTYFLILAPLKAATWENAMLFPAYAVLSIVVCNAWSQALYKEKVNWKANALAFAGIVLGTLGSV